MYLERLTDLARKAHGIDKDFYEDINVPKEEVEQWAVDAMRAAGDLDGAIAKLEGRPF